MLEQAHAERAESAKDTLPSISEEQLAELSSALFPLSASMSPDDFPFYTDGSAFEVMDESDWQFDQEQYDYTLEETRFMHSLKTNIIEKQQFQADSEIVAFEFLNIKPLTKASSGGLLTQGIVIATETNELVVYDIYKNQLLKLTSPGPVRAIAGTPQAEDMFFAALTRDGELCEYQIELLRNFQMGKSKESLAAEEKKTEGKSDEMYSKKYKNLLAMYKYRLTASYCINLHDLVGRLSGRQANDSVVEDALEFEQVIVFMIKGEKYYVVSDSKGFLTTLHRGLRFRSRFKVSNEPIQHLMKQSTTILFTTGSQVKALLFNEGIVAPGTCNAGT